MNVKLHFLVSIFLGGFLTVNGQNTAMKSKMFTQYEKNDKIKLEKFAGDIAKTYNTARLESRAKELGKPLTFKDIKGNNVFAVGVNKLGDIIYLTTYNSGSRVMSNVNDIAPDGELGLHLDGEGVTIGLWDGDVALGTHREFVENSQSRVIMNEIPFTDKSSQSGFVSNRAHATHVAGTIGAAGVDDKAKGMAPKATITSYNWDNDIIEMLNEAEKGLLVSNHSYGLSAYNEYGQEIPVYYYGSYDDRSVDADVITSKFRYYLPVLAAGNDGWMYPNLKPNRNKGGNHLLLGMNMSKNAVSVAAVEPYAQYPGAANVKLALFSSTGPTSDFRIKPDISAKGVEVFSTNFISKNNTSSYKFENGTSMAAPAVTGIVGLWQQWAIEYNAMPYLSSTIKAIMIHSALEAGNAPGPDHRFGWGVIDARKGVELMIDAKEERNVVLEENELNQSEQYSRSFKVGPNGTMFKATIAWTDPEGRFDVSNFNEEHVKDNPLLVNDLDLRVYKDGVEFLPWRLNKDFKLLEVVKGDNEVDNVEQVEIEFPEEGEYEIVVSHKGSLKDNLQAYALILSTDAEIIVDEIIEPVKELVIWPNPVVNDMHIMLPTGNDFDLLEVTIFDANGRMVSREVIRDISNQDEVVISTASLEKGLYFVEMKNSKIKKMDKIIKK